MFCDNNSLKLVPESMCYGVYKLEPVYNMHKISKVKIFRVTKWYMESHNVHFTSWVKKSEIYPQKHTSC